MAAATTTLVGAAFFLYPRPAGPGDTPPPAQSSAPARSTEKPPNAEHCRGLSPEVAALSTRDKLAQLLMVGVTGAADARAVIADQHVGGIFIGSWTDPMLTSGAVHAVAATSKPLPVAVSVDEEGGRVQRLAGLIGLQPSARELARSDSPQQVHDIALVRGRKIR